MASEIKKEIELEIAHVLFLDDKDQAFAWLERAHRQQDGGLAYYPNDPLLDRLRSDPRWAAFQRKMAGPTTN